MRYEIEVTTPRPETEAMEDRLADLMYETGACLSVSAHSKRMVFCLRKEGPINAAKVEAGDQVRAAWRAVGCAETPFVRITAKQAIEGG